MQSRRLERKKSKRRREELLEAERKKRRQLRKERREREEQVRDSMHAAAEEARLVALAEGRTREEAVAEAAAAAARVVDDESTCFYSANADSDEDSFVDDCIGEESEVPFKSPPIDDTLKDESNSASAQVSTSKHEPFSEDINLALAKSETEVCQDQIVARVVGDEETTDGDTGASDKYQYQHDKPGANEAIANSTNNDLAQHESNFQSSDTSDNDSSSEALVESKVSFPDSSSDGSNLPDTNFGCADLSGSNIPNTSCSSCKSLPGPKTIRTLTANEVIEEDSTAQSTSSSVQNEEQENTLLPSHYGNRSDEGSKLIRSQPIPKTPIDASSKTQSYESTDKTPTVEAKSMKIKTGSDRKFCNVFPSFSDIFANLSANRRQKSTADVNQRELSKSIQHQIGQYGRLHKTFGALNEATHQSEADDSSSSDSSDTNTDSFDQGLFYRISSRRPEVTAIIRNAFSHRQLSAWDEHHPDIVDSCWNLQWVWGLPKASDFENLLVFQKINRFRNT